MKFRRKELALRPIVPGFMKIIPRLPAMVCKKEILFKIFTPITCIFRGIKNIFKRKPSSRMIRHAALETKAQYIVSQKKGYKDCNMQQNRHVSISPHHLEFIHKQKTAEIAEIFKWQGTSSSQKTCLSCQEDRPAYNTCRMCLKLHSTLPPPSCRKCQKEKPLLNLCMKYHGNKPVIYLRDEEQNVAIYESFIKDLKKLQRRQVSTRCIGKTHMINNCPMCLSFWPTVAECGCYQCKLNQPVVKVFSPKGRKMMMIDLCPCMLCIETHPKIKVCSTCKGQKRVKLKDDSSIYLLIK